MELRGWVLAVLENGYFSLWIKVIESHDSPTISHAETAISGTGDRPRFCRAALRDIAR
jgi:hypothetical protein